MTLDGYDQPIELVAALTIGEDGIAVDYAGTSPVSRYGINVPKTYCEAYTGFGLACAVAPEVPNNAGSLGVFRVRGAGRLHPQRALPQPGREPPRDRPDAAGRGVRLPDQAMPGRVPAEGTSCLWTLALGRRPPAPTAMPGAS